MASQSSNETSRSLGAGDAVVVIALLLFICGWGAGWILLPDWKGFDKNTSVLFDIVLLFVIFGPPLWAADLIGDIIGKSLGGGSKPQASARLDPQMQRQEYVESLQAALQMVATSLADTLSGKPVTNAPQCFAAAGSLLKDTDYEYPNSYS